MHEPLQDRLRELEKSVQRWRRVSLALALMVVSLLAIIGTFGLLYLLNEIDGRDFRAQAMEARMQADRANLEAQRALQAAEEARLKLLQEHVDGALKDVR